MPIGKKVTIKDYKFDFGDKAKEFYVFACVKYRGDIFAIYTDVYDTENKLCYGSAHITKDTLVVLNTNDPREIDGIKNLIVKLINNQELDDYEIISLDKVGKIEIIGCDSFIFKKEIIDKLIDVTIPKDDTKVEEVVLIKSNPNKKSKVKYVFIVFLLLIAIGGVFVYFNQDMIFGTEKQVLCSKDLDREYNANVNQAILFYFDNQDNLTGYTMTNTYIFDTDEDYQDFSLAGRYFRVFDNVSSDKLNLVPNVENKTYQVGYTMSPLVDYFGPTEYYAVFEYYEMDGYTCNSEE